MDSAGDAMKIAPTAIEGRTRSIVPRLYAGKITPPQRPPDYIARSRIVQEVGASTCPVTLFVAPAGFGKTSTMSLVADEWNAGDTPTAWVSADERDNDFSRFFVYLREALLRLPIFDWQPDLGVPSGSETAFSGMRAEAFELIDRIAGTPHPFALFIDGFEKIQSPEVIRLIDELARSLNPGQRLIIGARTVKALSITALEIAGQVLRIDAKALRFDLAETELFLQRQRGLVISPKELELVWQKTEGWPAVLRLVTLARPAVGSTSAWIEDLSARSGSITQYLAENVLSRLPERLCDFMLQTSMLDVLYANLCNAVLESEDSEEMLAEVHYANLFLTLIDARAGCYQFHSLFRNFLQTQLRRKFPDLLTTLHRRAAVFYSSSARYADAVSHAIEAGDIALASDIVDLCALRYVELGQLETVAGWIDTIPGATQAPRSNTQRARAYAMIALHRYDEAKEALDILRAMAESQGQDLDPEATTQLALMYEWMDRHDLSGPEVERIAEQVTPDNHLAYAISRNMIAFLATIHGDYAGAQRAIDSVKAAYAAGAASSWPSTYTQCFEGCLEMIRANVRGAENRFENALASASLSGHSVPSAYLSDVLYAKGELDRAGSLAEEHLQLNRHIAPPDIVMLSYRTAARVSFLNGNLDHVESVLAELGDTGDLRNVPRMKAVAWLEKSRLALLSGDGEAANRYLNLASNRKIWAIHEGTRLYAQEIDDPALAALRIALVIGDPETIIAPLEAAVREADGAGRLLRRLRLQNFLAQAYWRTRKRRQGIDTLESALLAGAGTGLIYVFADEPWCLQELLEAVAQSSDRVDPVYLAQVVEATRLVASRIGEFAIAKTHNDLLTLKETAIIRLVADGKANKEIARILNISDNTVETHLRRIFQKLGSRNRTQAVSKAREFGLLR